MSRYFLDIESNGLLMDATQVWCVVLKNVDTGDSFSFADFSKINLQPMFDDTDELIGHNIIAYDLPVLRKLLGINYEGKVTDTLLISRLLKPDRPGGHSLAEWGLRLGFPKGDFKDFSKYSNEMLEYCKNDVNVTEKLYHKLKSEMSSYGMTGDEECFELENKFAAIINHQIQAGFTLDVKKAEQLLDELTEENETLAAELHGLMPYTRPTIKHELLSETDRQYTYVTLKTMKVVTKDKISPNPGSRQQIADFLISKGWKPEVFTETKQPKVDEKILSTIDIPEAKLISRYFRTQKMMSMIKNDKGGWLNFVRPDTGRVHGDVLTNSTNTGRCSHSKPNMAQVDKKMREVWIPKAGWKLVDVDAAGLEARGLGHYMAPYDGGTFGFLACQPKHIQDIHEENRKIFDMENRDNAKTMLYALIYGAGNKKLGSIYAHDKNTNTKNENVLLHTGKTVRDSIQQSLKGYKELVDDVAKAFKQRGYLKGIDGRPLHPRNDYSALNLLIQSAGAIICKKWLVNLHELMSDPYFARYLTLGEHYNYLANVHDEIVIEVESEEKGKKIIELARKAMELTGQQLHMNVKLDIDENG